MLWPATVTVHLHDTIDTKGLTKNEVAALRDRVREIISAAVQGLNAADLNLGTTDRVEIKD
jgi:hypothetical protein